MEKVQKEDLLNIEAGGKMRGCFMIGWGYVGSALIAPVNPAAGLAGFIATTATAASYGCF